MNRIVSLMEPVKPKRTFKDTLIVGYTAKTRRGLEYTIVGIVDGKYEIEFTQTKSRRVVSSAHLYQNEIRDLSIKTKYGGLTGQCKQHPLYYTWYDMIVRASEYNVKVDDRFLDFQFFVSWSIDQVKDKGWQLTRLYGGPNANFSPETCFFAPSCIVRLAKTKVRGYAKVKNRYAASLNIDGRAVYLGLFETIEEARAAYTKSKLERIKQVADEWKDRIDPKLYQAMINYEVEFI